MGRPSSSFLVDGVLHKKCSGCGQVKPHSEYAKDSSRAHGIRSVCKPCGSKSAAKWNRENHERYRENLERWRSENADRAAETSRIYHENNRIKKREAAHEWYRNNRDRAIANRSEYRKKNKAVELEKMRRYWRENRPVYLAKASRRRASQNEAFKPFDVDLLHLVELEAFDLARRRRACTGTAWHVDHVIPIISIRVHSLSAGTIPPQSFCGPLFPVVQGLHNEFNLAVIPASENVSKSNRRWPDMP